MQTKTLCLLWQNQQTRQWYHIANLTLKVDGMYSFSYELEKKKRGLKEALQNGYHLHPSFPDAIKRYQSDKLFSTFSRRLPNKSRPDYLELLRANNLKDDSDEFEILSLTGGRLISDNYEFVKPVYFDGKKFSFDFYVRGWRYYNDEEYKIDELSKISLETEEENEQDPDAIMVRYEDKVIGYVPAFYSEFMKAVMDSESNYTIMDIQYNTHTSSHRKLNISINGEVEDKKITDYKVDLLVTV